MSRAKSLYVKVDLNGLEKIENDLNNLKIKALPIAKQAQYEGAGIIAEEYKNQIRALPIQERYSPKYGIKMSPLVPFEVKRLKGLPTYMVRDMMEGMGISKMDYDGKSISSAVGTTGYGSVPTKKYPSGVPNILVLRAIESGNRHSESDFKRSSIHVTARAKNASLQKAKSTVEKKYLKEIKKELKHGN